MQLYHFNILNVVGKYILLKESKIITQAAWNNQGMMAKNQIKLITPMHGAMRLGMPSKVLISV
ncbi:MAG: hypothetical protein WBA93_28815 [Microcoleaceae cyanobacterium]